MDEKEELWVLRGIWLKNPKVAVSAERLKRFAESFESVALLEDWKYTDLWGGIWECTGMTYGNDDLHTWVIEKAGWLD